MTIWLDAHLSPSMAKWITATLGFPAIPVRDLGLRDAKDKVIFQAAREADVIVMTKDSDFSNLLTLHGPPPRIIWLTCGNTSEQNLKEILRTSIAQALKLLAAGEAIVEITQPTKS